MLKKKSHKLLLLIGIVQAVLGIISLSVKTDIIKYFNADPFIVLTATIGILLSGIVFVLYVYLQGGFLSNVNLDSVDDDEIKKYLDQFADRFISKIEATENSGLNEEEMKALITNKVDSITNEAFTEKIDKQYGAAIQEDLKHRDLFRDFEETKKRLERETYRISRNSNVNLLIGVITTGMAIFFLAYSLLGFQVNSSYEVLWNFIPRIALSIFIELFSFFFLKLYKRNLEDIKYFSNEKTNIDLKIIALRTALVYGDMDMTKEIVITLCKTERNFVLKKGESTIDLERNHLDSKAYIKTIENLTNILNKK